VPHHGGVVDQAREAVHLAIEGRHGLADGDRIRAMADDLAGLIGAQLGAP